MDYKKGLKEKIDASYEQRIKQWLASDPAHLITMAEEIVATRLVYDNLLHVISDGGAVFLSQLDDPLEAVSSRWRRENSLGAVHNDELAHCVSSLRLEALDLSQQLTVREFIIQNPGDAFSLMTSSGFVDLTADQATDLLNGNCVVGDPGASGFSRKVMADELLTQVVLSANMDKGIWYLMTDHLEMSQDGPEMGVTMC